MSPRQINELLLAHAYGQVNLRVILSLKFDLTIACVDLQAGAEVDCGISTSTY